MQCRNDLSHSNSGLGQYDEINSLYTNIKKHVQNRHRNLQFASLKTQKNVADPKEHRRNTCGKGCFGAKKQKSNPLATFFLQQFFC
jgi:hypothetical protein